MNIYSIFVRRSLAAIGLAIFMAAGAVAAEPDDGTAAGRAALSQRDFAAARQHFGDALRAARKARDQQRVADTLFYLGVTAQQSAASAPDPAGSLATARRYYNDAIRIRPRFPAALNNLAEVYLAEKNPKRAGETLRRAIAAGGSREGVYAQKYADLLLQEGNGKEAARFYAQAAGAQPDNEAVRQRLVDLCLKFDPPALIGYLWELATQGQVLPVQRIAIQILPRREWSEEHRDELVTIIAVCLGRQNYPPAEFAKTEAANLLRKLPRLPAINELFELHQGKRLTADVYPWWVKRIRHNTRPVRVELWPQEAFRQLVCALGARWRPITGGEEQAIAYYRLAAFLDPREPDPEALTRLAELYGSTQRLDELTEVMNRHENEIFSAKGEAYHADKLEKIYQFHTALGVIYSTLGVWGDDRTPTSAIFQLEQATRIAQRAPSVRPPAGSPKPTSASSIKPAPQLVNLLADAYVKTNNPTKAFDLKVDQGQAFFRAGDVAAAREVLRDADKVVPASVSSARKATLKTLQRDIPNLNVPRKSAQFRSTTPAAVDTPTRTVGTSLPAKVPAIPTAKSAAMSSSTAAAATPAKTPAKVPSTSTAFPAKTPATSMATPTSSSLAKVPTTSTAATQEKRPADVRATTAGSAARVPATSSAASRASSPTPTRTPAAGMSSATQAARSVSPATSMAAAGAKPRSPVSVTLATTSGVDGRKLGALTDMVRALVAKPATSASGSTALLALPREAIALNVQEIVVQGSKGRITVKEGTKTMTIPFTIAGGEAPRSSSTTRYVRK